MTLAQLLYSPVGVDVSPYLHLQALFETDRRYNTTHNTTHNTSGRGNVSWLHSTRHHDSLRGASRSVTSFTLNGHVTLLQWRAFFQHIREDESLWSRLLSDDRPSPTSNAKRLKTTRVALTKAVLVAQLRMDQVKSTETEKGEGRHGFISGD